MILPRHTTGAATLLPLVGMTSYGYDNTTVTITRYTVFESQHQVQERFRAVVERKTPGDLVISGRPSKT